MHHTITHIQSKKTIEYTCQGVFQLICRHRQQTQRTELWLCVSWQTDNRHWWGAIWHRHGDWTRQPSGMLTSLNHQVGLSRHRLLFHLHTVSEAANMSERKEWQRPTSHRVSQQLIVQTAKVILTPLWEAAQPLGGATEAFKLLGVNVLFISRF